VSKLNNRLYVLLGQHLTCWNKRQPISYWLCTEAVNHLLDLYRHSQSAISSVQRQPITYWICTETAN